ncbi:MAG: tetratricopeptide repeat protein [Candidatus Ozemobacteraceae bacterium]
MKRITWMKYIRKACCISGTFPHNRGLSSVYTPSCLCVWCVGFVLLGFFLTFAVQAQEGDEAADFLKRGIDLYKSRDVQNAVVEFENVLLIDSTNIDAQIWLVRIYADLKQIKKAHDLLTILKKQAPDHPRVQELETLFGAGGKLSLSSPTTGTGASDASGKTEKKGKKGKGKGEEKNKDKDSDSSTDTEKDKDKNKGKDEAVGTGEKSELSATTGTGDSANSRKNGGKTGKTSSSGDSSRRNRGGDLVMHETLTLLGSGTSLRPYGLVIPETRVRPPVSTEVTLASDVENVPDTDPAGGTSGAPLALEKFDAEEGPLAGAFDAWATDGLSAGLMKYFELVLKDKSLGALNDKKILEAGITYFTPRYVANPKDEDAVFYLGMIAFLSGNMERSQGLLETLRNTDRPFKKMLTPVFAEFDRLKSEEEARKLALKREEDAREEARQKAEEAAAQASASAVLAANIASSGVAASATLPAANSPEAFDAEGYDLYKKGQLDTAVEKFQVAIKGNANDPKYHYHLGLALTDKGLAGSNECFDRAIEAFNKVVQLDPGGKLAKDAEVMIRDLVAAKNSVRN